MIIQCEQCQTKFKLDDSKVADKSIKVRCARCRHVFSVAATQGVPEDAAPFEQNVPVFQIEDEMETTAEPSLERAMGFESEMPSKEDASGEASLLDSFSFAEGNEQAAAAPPPTVSGDSDFFFPAADSAVTSDQVETQKDPDDLDFGAFDFGDESGDADEPAASATTMDFKDSTVKQEQAATPPKGEFGGLDFSGDDMFGDIVSTAPEE
jgi:predicted Zn finger-like uncharacterized protein